MPAERRGSTDMLEAGPSPVRMVQLARAESLELLAGVSLGRVVFSHRALPAVRPVNHIVVGGDLIIRSHAGAGILGPAASSGVVAYEADELDPKDHTGWSVIVTGTASLVRDAEEVATYTAALTPWIGAEMDHVIRISSDIVTGYRLTREPGEDQAG